MAANEPDQALPTPPRTLDGTPIGVVGCGYLGTTHAACLSHWGFDVVAYDLDLWKIDSLRNRTAPFFEDLLNPLLEEGIESGRLTFVSDLEALRPCRLVFCCVGTPEQSSSPAADLSQVHTALASLTSVLSPGSVVVGKSTTPVGTANLLAYDLAKTGLHLAWNPEFLREGTAVNDTLHPERIVLGTPSSEVDYLVRSVYAAPLAEGSEWVLTDRSTAEMIKVSSNAFLASKVSFINAVADLCSRTGADVATVAHAMGIDSRIGRKFLAAGLGYGGGCFPKDVRALAYRAAELGADSLAEMLHATDRANVATRHRALALLREHLPSSAAKVAFLGASFKPGSDDVRDSPARWLVQEFRALYPNIRIGWHDPGFKSGDSVDGLTLASSAALAVEDADLVVLSTEWPQYRSLDPAQLTPSRRVILDLRNALPPKSWVASGWSIFYLGRPPRTPE